MDERHISDLVKGWREKARNERDHVSKFVFLWFCFNATLAFESNEDTDRSMVNWLKGYPPSRLTEAFETARRSEVFTRNLAALADYSPITDPRGKRDPVVITGVEDFANLVEGIYRVRCNLFHGAKSSRDVRDDKLLRVCAAILDKWVGNLVTMWR